jgi:riboflavin kinase/FMN adenylyltransferase
VHDRSVSEGSARGGLVVIGNFDGVHRGHQALLADAADEGARRTLAPIALTFHPHPSVVLGRPEPPVLTALPRKIELIERVAPGLAAHVEPFDRAFAAQTADEFASRILVAKLSARVVLVGQNFRFGKGRAGDFAALVRLGGQLGFEARSHKLVGDEAGPWSSTRVRAAVAQGDLAAAEAMLGRPHMVSGVVVRGDQRGRTIGFPTCNLDEVVEALPPNGVYAVLVDRELDAKTDGQRGASSPRHAEALARGVANIGVRPTVDPSATRPRVEVHLFDVDEDLYGARLRVHLVGMLRPERKFAGLDELRAQIGRDADDARAMTAALAPDPSADGAFR